VHASLRGSRYLNTPGELRLASRILRELASWRGLSVTDLPLEEEALAADLAEKVGLDFDDGLHYYAAKKLEAAIDGYDGDFEGLDVRSLSRMISCRKREAA